MERWIIEDVLIVFHSKHDFLTPKLVQPTHKNMERITPLKILKYKFYADFTRVSAERKNFQRKRSAGINLAATRPFQGNGAPETSGRGNEHHARSSLAGWDQRRPFTYSLGTKSLTEGLV